MLTQTKITELTEKSREIRGNIIRMLGASASGHPGGSLSAADLLTYLYFHQMRHDPKNPKWAERDRFVLSKGHAAPVLYATLAEAGYFSKEDLVTLRKFGSHLQGHPDMKKTPGIDMSTGSLGQGLSSANGMALAARLNQYNNHIYVLLGDGEIEEGQVWEAAMTSAHYKLDNLTAFLDYNHLQIDGPVENVKSMTGPMERFKAFGWHVIEANGHDLESIDRAVTEALNTKGKPTMVVLNTVKGKGVSFMENQASWHGTAPKPNEVEQALKELGLS
ncbi:MAG TPA: transketolase [Bacillota bacterium]|nr:transketolase [Bacillota bacterium]